MNTIVSSGRYAILLCILLCGTSAENVATKKSTRLETGSATSTPASLGQSAEASPKLKSGPKKIKLTKLVLPPTDQTAIKVTVKSDNSTTATLSEELMDASQDGLSPIIFLFCVVLTIVAVMLVVRIIFSSKKRQFNTFGGNGFWTSRSSTQSGGRLSLGGGPALGMPTGNISLGSGTAAYTAMPTQPTTFGHQAAVSEGGIRDPNLDWERQFFEHTGDDDEEHLTTNMEVEPTVGSKLQLN